MKKLTYLICTIILLTYGCKPNRDCCVLPQKPSGITADKNGASWAPSGVTGTLVDENFTLAAGSFSSSGSTYAKIDSLNIQLTFNGTIGSYKLSGKQGYYAVFGNNGAVTTSYKLDTTFNNVLNVTSYKEMDNTNAIDQNYVLIKGTFSLKFIDPANASGISFSNGTFFTTIKH